MNDKTLVERLELAANDAIHDDAANAIRAAILEMARLDAENFRLAAGSCDVEGGKIGDEHGHFRCSLQSRIEALEAALRFYARENSWKSCGVYMSGQSQPSSAEVDRGNKARKALEGSGND